MNDWIRIEDQLPEDPSLTKYHVKVLEGSINAKEEERVILGKKYVSGFRFLSGDWQRVTHWKPYE